VRSAATGQRPSAIPGYEDWPAYVRRAGRHACHSGPAQELAEVLGVPAAPPPPQVRTDWEKADDGVTTSQLSWQLGFGPRTRAWLIRPADTASLLPGVLALHCHGGSKFGGADRLVHLPDNHPSAVASRTRHYDGRPLATDLARRGFAVLAHDTFGWGSRRFNLASPPRRTAEAVEARHAQWREAGVAPSEEAAYDAAASAHEDTIAKAAGLIGTSFAGTVAHDDLAALEILATLPGVDPARLGCLGFSGGGGRSLVLAALSPRVRSYVVSCMMTTFEALFPAYLDEHSWLLETPGLWSLCDWPEITEIPGAASFLVQYAMDDELFPESGMLGADLALRSLHRSGAYRGSFWPGRHEFTAEMQAEAAAFLRSSLASSATSLR
jgi:dienelactone hydrolase